MAPTECPNCAAERWAGHLRSAIAVAAAAAVLLTAIPCLFAFLTFRHVEGRDRETPFWMIAATEAALRLVPIALVLAGVTLAMIPLSRYLRRRSTASVPRPDADPLATYREGGSAGCPRHPFAR